MKDELAEKIVEALTDLRSRGQHRPSHFQIRDVLLPLFAQAHAEEIEAWQDRFTRLAAQCLDDQRALRTRAEQAERERDELQDHTLLLQSDRTRLASDCNRFEELVARKDAFLAEAAADREHFRKKHGDAEAALTTLREALTRIRKAVEEYLALWGTDRGAAGRMADAIRALAGLEG
jgi:chromosome segregation ATPase